MKTYHIIDKRDRNVRSELKHYTFEQVKDYFEPNSEFVECHEKWENIKDLSDLEEYLKYKADGMEQNCIIEEDEEVNIESMNRANKFYNQI